MFLKRFNSQEMEDASFGYQLEARQWNATESRPASTGLVGKIHIKEVTCEEKVSCSRNVWH